MTTSPLADLLALLPLVTRAPSQRLRASYDAASDVLYLAIGASAIATDSELTDDDVIIRYDGADAIGYTVLRARQRLAARLLQTPSETTA